MRLPRGTVSMYHQLHAFYGELRPLRHGIEPLTAFRKGAYCSAFPPLTSYCPPYSIRTPKIQVEEVVGK